MLTIWVGHVTLCTAYVTVVIRSRLVEMDRSLEEAAMDLGRAAAENLFVITLPLILPAIGLGLLLSFTLSLDDLVMTAFLSGPGSTTLPQLIFSRVRLGLNPEINALGTLTVLVVAVLVISANRIMLRQEKRRAAGGGQLKGSRLWDCWILPIRNTPSWYADSAPRLAQQ